MNDLTSFYEASAKTVDTVIAGLIDAAAIDSDRLKSAMLWSLFGGGKRFRPALVFAVGETLDAPRESLLRTAAAVEMIHTYSLIHDDLPAMDDDDLRRGRETCHKKFDVATAILAGDALQVLAFDAIANDKTVVCEKRLELVAGLAAAAVRMVVGQQLDLECEGKAVSGEQVETIHRNKTGALITFCGSAAATIADTASEERRTAASNYASSLGLLFQITDDLLDVTQSSAALGKTAGKDVRTQKATYPSVFGNGAAVSIARETHTIALAALAPFGEKAIRLRQIADFILDRRN